MLMNIIKILPNCKKIFFTPLPQAITVITLIFSFFLFFTTKIWVVGDGVSYYAWLRSAIFDHDVQFANEFSLYNTTHSAVATTVLPNGMTPNVFSIGPAVLWAPVYTIVLYLLKIFFSQKVWTGYEFPFLLTISSLSISFGFIGLLLNFYLAKLMAIKDTQALLVTLAIFLTSPLPQYIFDESNYAHIFSFFFISLLLFVWIKFFTYSATKKYILLGLIIGLATLMRWQQIIFLLIPASELIYKSMKQKKTIYWIVQNTMYCGISSLIIVLPQFVAWQSVFGQWLTIPQGTGFISPSFPSLIQFLISPLHGLFFWHPGLILGTLGLCFFAYKTPKKGLPLCLILIGEILLLSGVVDWWAGAAFGSRRMVDSLPLFTVGFAYLLKIISPKKRLYLFVYAVIYIALIWNVILWFQYVTTIPHDVPLSILNVIKQYSFLPEIIFNVFTRSTFFTLIYQQAFFKIIGLIVTYCAIIGSGLITLQIALGIKH